ncbi:MAG: radical SAM protein [Thermoproteota archaeon]|nr:radical SAM protein [Thermoproteota archaeon]
MRGLWHSGKGALLEEKRSKSIIHPFVIKNYRGLTINPYQGCSHRCAYCYATYDWSPEFYDKVYAKSNAPQILYKELAAWNNSDAVMPVMVASATDPYQPAELRFQLTRRCIQVLQKFNVPYYVFTKSTLIERDLELHSQYHHNCFLVWSVTTCNERTRRLIEPGTAPSSRIFKTIKKCAEAGLCCGVNIDPIIPLVTDSEHEMYDLVKACKDAGVKHAFGAPLRLRADIWQRMKLVLQVLEVSDGIKRYKDEIYGFEEPLESSYVTARSSYTNKTIRKLDNIIQNNGIKCDFPDYLIPQKIDKSSLGQTTLHRFVDSAN